jgi:hypothetical protein
MQNIKSRGGPSRASRAGINTRASRCHSESIPAELKSRPQWVLLADGVPSEFCPPPDTWRCFEDVLRDATSLPGANAGFVLNSNDPYSVIVLDNVRDTVTGKVDARAVRMTYLARSYTETDLAGTGLRTIVRAALPFGARSSGVVSSGLRAKIYDRDYSFPVTGRVWNRNSLFSRIRSGEEIMADIALLRAGILHSLQHFDD